MLIQGVFICIFAKVLLIESSGDNLSADVRRPKSISIEAHNEQIRRFWTPKRLRAAKPLDMILPNLPHGKILANNNVSIGPKLSIPGSLPSNNHATGKYIYQYGRQYYTTGRVFWQVGAYSYSC